MIRYHHRQVGTLVLCIGGGVVLLFVLILFLVEVHPVGIGVLLVLVLCLGLFWSLTVDVTETDVVLRFGFGLIRRRFPLGSIVTARAVRNEWSFGWGIRTLPRGWLYNVSGLDAIELEMADGGVHRIGTDQPAELLRAIEEAKGMIR